MAGSRDFLFCDLCGTTLTLGPKFVTCPLCKFKKDAKEVAGKEITYTIAAKDIRKEVGISRFQYESVGSSRCSTIKRICERCQHPEMEFTTRQLRSADEGQTTFYRCPNCKYHVRDN